MLRTSFAVLGACAFVTATLPAQARPRDYVAPAGYYQIPQDDGAYAAARRTQGVKLNIPWAQWSNEIDQPPGKYRARATRTPDARTWYVPAPDGAQRHYASAAPASNDYYYPQGAYRQPAYQPDMSEPESGSKSTVLDARFRRQLVNYHGQHKAGTIIIDTEQRFLFLVQGDGMAVRYGIGVGRPGFEWAGVKTVSRKAEWPDWTPPDEMLERRPDLPRFMAGGPGNPLGARAMYLGSSLYRIHGTNEPQTIGKAVSSGCIRMVNDDVIDLYERVRVGTKVIVI